MKNISKLTLADLKAMKPRREVLAFAKSCDGDMQKFWDTCPDGDWLLWLLRKTGNLNEMDARRIALAFAKRVLPIFERVNPCDSNPRSCLQAVERFLKNPTVVNERAMIAAAYEVHATYTAYAAASAAFHAAFYPHATAAADYAVYFATSAADVIESETPIGSTINADARRKFEQWGANKVRSIIKLK